MQEKIRREIKGEAKRNDELNTLNDVLVNDLNAQKPFSFFGRKYTSCVRIKNVFNFKLQRVIRNRFSYL